MINDFLNYFESSEEFNWSGDLYNDFITKLGGKRFGEGLFNSFSMENVSKWTEIIDEAYPAFKGLYKAFGYDWLGRCFGIDLRKDTFGNVLMFEIGTNDVLEIPCSFENFLNEEIPLYSDACLAKSFYDEWKNFSGKEISYGRCAGYKIPLFLGGEDNVNNLEDSDMEVYWSVLTQVKNR
ncbi:MAG: DUF1851 domain-containing protein [Butyrivibrio sp.]|nr:DUF1851 domain-containing protein [Butyrivibrio sp.]